MVLPFGAGGYYDREYFPMVYVCCTFIVTALWAIKYAAYTINLFIDITNVIIMCIIAFIVYKMYYKTGKIEKIANRIVERFPRLKYFKDWKFKLFGWIFYDTEDLIMQEDMRRSGADFAAKHK
jgi:hypothetical protein